MKKMKSFRLYVPGPPPAPERVVSDFSVGEKAAFAETFKPLLERYRTRIRIGWAVGLVSVACVVLNAVLGLFWLEGFTGFAFGFLVIVTLIYLGKLPNCPGCGNQPHHPPNQFCPECGSRALQRAGSTRHAHCRQCGLAIQSRKGRHHKIRHCTHCGLHLDEHGL
ncbi:hypothetical protein [Roseimicrobium gellanilyticum]|uniref:hypothetical protein n=1 Tax=Roseimicrobium gellanilyticum TaxID=748857 RepID=UPI0011BD6F5F|nr:hypothetical protein [Roseimicrobium gellanilyticum]